VYSLIKRPFILDLQPGRSVVEALTKQGFEVYMIDWVPPSRTDSWRGFDAYVNGGLANAVRAVQIREEVEQVSLLGYCFGGLLTTLYTALYPETVKNLITFTLPLDMSVQELSMNALLSAPPHIRNCGRRWARGARNAITNGRGKSSGRDAPLLLTSPLQKSEFWYIPIKHVSSRGSASGGKALLMWEGILHGEL
jgi:pimeloyl-ACP methyl ester carboxylesterase